MLEPKTGAATMAPAMRQRSSVVRRAESATAWRSEVAVARLEPGRVLTVEQIVALAIKRKAQHSSRDDWYDTLLRYYYGKNANAGSDAMSIVAMNSQGRPMLRDHDLGGHTINNPRTYD